MQAIINFSFSNHWLKIDYDFICTYVVPYICTYLPTYLPTYVRAQTWHQPTCKCGARSGLPHRNNTKTMPIGKATQMYTRFSGGATGGGGGGGQGLCEGEKGVKERD